MITRWCFAAVLTTFMVAGFQANAAGYPKADGYRGIWYYNQPTNDAYVYKYSGGLGTYCADHIPMAVYAPAVEKTFFVYGGRPADKNTLFEMISYYDHRSGRFPRPTILIDKKTDDAHDNPVLSIDSEGYLWVFASSHGTSRPSYLFRSKQPYAIDDFEVVQETNFSYPQPWYLADQGFLFLHTYYKSGRGLNWSTSADGRTWSERQLLAHIQEGHYQISWPHGSTVGTAFNYHPTAFGGDAKKKGLNWRTNLYYMETRDFGKTWKNVLGQDLETPLVTVSNPALVHDYESEGLLVYLQSMQYDGQGRPVLLFTTSKGWKPGPEQGPHTWRIAHWTGQDWTIHSVTESDSNYDVGALYVEETGPWRIIGPTEPGPQAYNPGGEIALWRSADQGVTWTRDRLLTGQSAFNHTYVRAPLHADPGFYAFWADGHGRQESPSRLYFYDAKKGQVYRLPWSMAEETAPAEPISAVGAALPAR